MTTIEDYPDLYDMAKPMLRNSETLEFIIDTLNEAYGTVPTRVYMLIAQMMDESGFYPDRFEARREALRTHD